VAWVDFQQFGVRPLFDGIGYRVLTGVDRGDERDGLVQEPVDRVDERRREQFHLAQLVDDHGTASLHGPLDGWQREALKRSNIDVIAAHHGTLVKGHVGQQCAGTADLLGIEPHPVA
jgi:hypothetical protein